MTGDPIDAAIAATDEPPMLHVPVKIASTGRMYGIIVPVDPPATEGELAELCGWMLTNLLGQVRAIAAAGKSPIVVARGMPQ